LVPQVILNKKIHGAKIILKGMNLEEGATGKTRNEPWRLFLFPGTAYQTRLTGFEPKFKKISVLFSS